MTADMCGAMPLCLTSDEKRVVGVACRMLLRLKQRVKVPKRRLHPTIGAHLFKAHFEKDLTVFGTCLEQRMQTAARRSHAESAKVVFLPLDGLPRTTAPYRQSLSTNSLHAHTRIYIFLRVNHIQCQIKRQFRRCCGEFFAFCHLKCSDFSIIQSDKSN